MITKTYYRRDPKSKKRKMTEAELTGVPAELAGKVTDNAADALTDDEGRPVIACVVLRGEDNGTD